MDSFENKNGQSLNRTDSNPDKNAGFSNWRSRENDSEHDSSHSNSTNNPTGTQTTSTSMNASDLDYIQDRFQQIVVSPGSLQGKKRKHDGRLVRNFVEYLSDYESWHSSVTFGSTAESPEMKDQATDVFDLNYYDRPRKKIKACRLKTRIRRMSFKKRKAYKKTMRCSAEVAPAYQSLHPVYNPVPSKKNETPKSNLKKRKRKIRRCSEKSFAESSEENSEETSSS